MGYKWNMGSQLAFAMDELCQAKQMSSIDIAADYESITLSNPIIEFNANDYAFPTPRDDVSVIESDANDSNFSDRSRGRRHTLQNLPVDPLAGYASFCRRHSVPTHSSGLNTSGQGSKDKTYKQKAKLNYARYRMKKGRAVPNGSNTSSDSGRSFSDTDSAASDDMMGYLKAAFQIMQWCADLISPQLMAFTSVEIYDAFSLMVEPLSKDEKEAFSSMNQEERLIFTAQWLHVNLSPDSKDRGPETSVCSDDGGHEASPVLSDQHLDASIGLDDSAVNASLGFNNRALGTSPALITQDLEASSGSNDQALEASLDLNNQALESAFTILRRFADQVESLWEEYVSLRAENCGEFLLTDSAFTKDEMDDFMAMGPEDRRAFYNQHRANELNTKKLVNFARRQGMAAPSRSSELSDPGLTFGDEFRFGLQHQILNRSTLLDYSQARINPKPSMTRTLRKYKKDRDYLGKDFPGFFPTVSQLDLSLDLSHSDQHKTATSKAWALPNPPYTKVRRDLSNFCHITFLERWIQFESDEETFFESFPWSSQPYKDFVTGWNDSITLYELRYIEDRQRERENEPTKVLDEVADRDGLALVKTSRQRRDASDPGQAKFHLLDKLGRMSLSTDFDTNTELDAFWQPQQVPSLLISPSEYSLHTDLPCVELSQCASRSDSVNAVTLDIPLGYGPSIPPRKPVAQAVHSLEAVEGNTFTLRLTPPNTPPAKSFGAVSRGEERSISGISNLMLSVPRICPDAPPAASDTPAEAGTTTRKPRRVSFAKVNYRTSIDDPTPTVGLTYQEDSVFSDEDFGRALGDLEPSDSKKSLTNRIRSKIRKAATPKRDIKTMFSRTPSWGSSWSVKEKTPAETDRKSGSASLGRGPGWRLKGKGSMENWWGTYFRVKAE